MTFSLTIHVCSAAKGHVSSDSARMLAQGLGAADHVTLDFSGVAGIGQDFAHEVIRVFTRGRPGARLKATNMKPAVAAVMWEAQVAAPHDSSVSA